MKKFFNGSVAILLSLLMLLATAALASAQDIPAVPGRDSLPQHSISVIDTLEALGLLWTDFNPNRLVTRASLAQAVVRMTGLWGVEASKNNLFADVAANSSDADAIYLAVESGIMDCADGDMFLPEAGVTYAEFIKTIIKILGYGAVCDINDTMKCLAMAQELKLTKNVTVAADANIKGEYAALIIYNSLEVDILGYMYGGENERVEVLKGVTILSKLDIEEGNGQVKATDKTSLLTGGKMVDGGIQIGSEVMKNGQTPFDFLLGYNVKYYAKTDRESGIKTLLYAEKSKNEELYISADDIDRNNSTVLQLVYYKNNRELRAKISQWADIVYNNKVMFDFRPEHILPETGNITLVDYNSDGVYEVVFTTEYKNIIVDEARRSTLAVTDLSSGKTLSLDPDDYEQLSICKNGREASFDIIKAGDVLSVFEGKNDEDGAYLEVYICDDMVTGEITELDDSDLVAVDGREYKRAYGFTETLRVGASAELCLDVFGNIAAQKGTVLSSEYVAVVIDAGQAEDLSHTVKLKLFTPDNTWIILPVADSLILDGSKEDSIKLLSAAESPLYKDGIASGVLITYRLNGDGEIKSINTPVKDLNYEQPVGLDKLRITADKLYRRYTTYTYAFMPQSRYLDLYVDMETVVFRVPQEVADRKNAESYSASNMNTFSSDSYYTVEGYNVSDSPTADIVLYYGNDKAEINERQSICVVDEVTICVDKNGEVVQKMYAYTNSSRTELEAENDYVLNNLRRGDVIQCAYNARGKVSNYKLLFNPKLPPLKKQGTVQEDSSIVNIANSLCTIYGRVVDKNADYITVYMPDNPDDVPKYLKFSTSKAKVYCLDKTKTEEEVLAISASDIETGQMVFLRAQTTQVLDILTIRE